LTGTRTKEIVPTEEKEGAEKDGRKYSPENHVPGHPALDDGVMRTRGIDVAESRPAARQAVGDPLLSSVAGGGR
jgi:hypothetical protein